MEKNNSESSTIQSIEQTESIVSGGKKIEKDSPEYLASLLEKNLKWSQIIYEQNKGIKNRLTWMAVGSYLRIALVMVPLIIGALYLPALYDKYKVQYESIFGGDSKSTGTPVFNFSKILQNFSPEQISNMQRSLTQ